jgi:hypothetical protein
MDSCHNDDFGIGGYLMEPRMQVFMVDTPTVKVYNIAMDSVITSNKGVAFAGRYNDPQIGRFTARTFVEFQKTQDTEADQGAMYDSVTLVLKPTGNYYGDTLKPVSFNIYELTAPIEMGEDGYMYSTSTMPEGATGELLADSVFNINVGAKEPIEIKLPDRLGMMLFDGILNQEPYMDDNENFVEAFPGISITAGHEGNCVYGFGVNDTSSCMIRIYYHVSSTFRTDKQMTFRPNTSKQFNSLQNEKLPGLPSASEDGPIPSVKTYQKGFLMSGTPLSVRIEFPYLNNFLNLSEVFKIKQAILIVRPVYDTYDTVPLPAELNLYGHHPISNDLAAISQGLSANQPLTSGSGNTEQILTGNLSMHYPNYEFDITNFVTSQLGKAGYDKRDLRLVLPESLENTSLQRLVFGDQQFWYKSEGQSRDNQIQLKVTYVTYQ